MGNRAIIFVILGVVSITLIGILGMSALINLGADPSGTGSVVTLEGEPQSKEEWEIIFKNAEATLKVPWELIAAIMYQESGLGHNFGKCSYFPTAPISGWVLTGAGIQIRKDGRDPGIFEKIVGLLGLAKNTPVSCNPKPTCCGGAMGYMQVMPAEWDANAQKLVSSGVYTVYPNPWKAQEAVYIGTMVLKGKVGLGPTDIFPEDATTIKNAAGGYYGSKSASYKDEVYARYLEIQARGHL